MVSIIKYKNDGTKMEKNILLKDDIFNIKVNKKVIYDVIIMQRNSLRRWTRGVKNRSLVRGGGHKPWKQKGTGRARQGSTNSPQWRGGGVVFGPNFYIRRYKFTKKYRKLAIKSILTQKKLKNDLLVVENINFNIPSTKKIRKIFINLNICKFKILFVVEKKDIFLKLSSRNLSNVTVIDVNNLNVLNIIKHKKILFTESSILKLEEII